MTINITLTTGEVVPTGRYSRAKALSMWANRDVIEVGGPQDAARPDSVVSKIYPAVIADIVEVQG